MIAAEPITTPRLTLVPLTPAHAEEMAAVLADPELYAFTGGGPPTPPELRAQYERWQAGSPDPAVSWCNWAIRLRSADCLTGTVQATISTTSSPLSEPRGAAMPGLRSAVCGEGRQRPQAPRRRAGNRAEIAWVVAIRWQGQGIATEAARALVEWLGRQSVRTVVAHIHPAHHASAAVAAAAGLTPTAESVAGETRWELRLNYPCA